MSPSRLSLQTLFERCGVRLTSGQYDLLWGYHRLLREADVRLNLTRIRNFDNMVMKHYVDCLLVLEHVELPSPLIDMGSGGGLPGIPLKIARPDVVMTLAEPRGARAEFLQEVCRRLQLPQIDVYAGKVGPGCPLRAQGVITRAVASIPETLDRVSEVIEPGGQMLLMKGPDCDEEIGLAERSHAGLFARIADQHYLIPGTAHERRIVVYRRSEKPDTRHGSRDELSAHPQAAPTREITSATNPTYKLCRDLMTGRGIRKHGRALMSGTRIINELARDHSETVESWLTPTGVPLSEPLVVADEQQSRTPTWLTVSPGLFSALDISGTGGPLALVQTPEMPSFEPEDEWPIGCTLFLPFQDPENIGAAIRSAVAFGVSRVVLLQEASHPFHPKSVRSGGTALLRVVLMRGPRLANLVDLPHPTWVLDNAISAESSLLPEVPFPETFGLVAGLEGPGVPEPVRRSSRPCRIPIDPTVESLNAAASIGIALYEWKSRQQRS